MLEAATQELAEMSRRCQEEFASAARSFGINSPATNSTSDGSTDENSDDDEQKHEEEVDLDVVTTTTSEKKPEDLCQRVERPKIESPVSEPTKLPFAPVIPPMFNPIPPQFAPPPMFPNQGPFFHAAAAAAAVYCGWYPQISSPPTMHAPSIFRDYLRNQRFHPYGVPNHLPGFSPNFGKPAMQTEPISPTNLSTSSRSSSDSTSPSSSTVRPREKSHSPAAPTSIRSIESLLTTASSAAAPFTSV